MHPTHTSRSPCAPSMHRAQCVRDVKKGAQMLTGEAIDVLLRGEEGETLALKERCGADVIETAVAFANTHGGTILMGVRDDAHITGERWGKEALRDYINRIATATEPAVVPAASRVALGAGEVVALQISEVPLKPVASPVIARSAATKQSSSGRGRWHPQPCYCEERSDEAIQQGPWQGAPPWIAAQRPQRQQPQEACSRTLGWYRTA